LSRNLKARNIVFEAAFSDRYVSLEIKSMKMKQKKKPLLSKSRFLAGLQCHLRLWYQSYEPYLASEVSPAQQAIFDTGHEVGRLATRLYTKGVLIKQDYLHHAEAVQVTLTAMQDPSVKAIYEAAFDYDRVRVRVDILERVKGGSWNLVEVKSSTSVKDVYLSDVAIQYYVLRGCGLAVDRAGILHLNNQYQYDGLRLEREGLFSFSDLTEQVNSRQLEVATRLADFKGMLAKTQAPNIMPSRHCKKPFECEFWEHCTRVMPEFWVLGLSGITEQKLNELAQMGINDIQDIPGAFSLTELQSRIRDCVLNQKEYISPYLANELTDVKYPIHFLDFETVSPAIPRYTGTKPYQAIPFQFSDHILFLNGSLQHQFYLCEEDKDPHQEFVRKLLESLGAGGTIFIYTTYELRVLNQLAAHFPKYRDQLTATLSRFKDLCAIIKKHFYHPKFYGSFSLKYILPALLPEMSYENLSIREGSQASLEYLRMIDSSTAQAEREKIRNDLLVYCGHDTLAMVKIRDELLKRLE
jgi:predicted RecB family nuclease